MRHAVALLLLSFVLVGCGEPSETTARGSAASAPDGLAQAAARPTGQSQLAYQHRLSIETAPESVAARFERARDACQAAAESGCVVLTATIDTGDPKRLLRPHASLLVRLPHDAVEPFIHALLLPLPDQQASDAVLRSRSTTAEDLTEAIADIERRLKQLMDYRERLTALAARPDAKLDELIKVENELSTVQSQIETLAGQQHGLAQRVATERLTIDIYAAASFDSLTGPLVGAWQDGRAVLGQNGGAALRVAIGALPWIPLAALAALLLRLSIPLLRRRRK
jgi:hypothetical protein